MEEIPKDWAVPCEYVPFPPAVYDPAEKVNCPDRDGDMMYKGFCLAECKKCQP